MTDSADTALEIIPATAPELALRDGTPEQFRQLRQLLQYADFTNDGICTRTGARSIADMQARANRPVNDALDLLIRLFIEGDTAPRELVDQHLSGHDRLLYELGLLIDLPDQLCCTSVALYPLDHLYLVSDHAGAVVGEGKQQTADVVYPAFSSNSAEFVDGLPETPCERLLDIGAGTGVAALLAAADWARHAWALDITTRATQVCEFNAKLNGIENVSALTGDLYDPVAGQTFDCIVSHPPYMPEPVSRIIFRDGGEDGEQITRRIIAGLPQYLSPGGRFYCRCMATDRKGAPLEQRLRAMLGPAHEEFDVLVVTNVTLSVATFYSRLFAKGRMTVVELERILTTFERLETENMVIGVVYIRRHDTPQAPLTLRRRLSQQRPAPDPQSYDWLLDWTRRNEQPAELAKLTDTRPVLAPQAQVTLKHRMHEGRLRAEGCNAATEFPFVFELEASPGTVFLLGACDGTRTALELYQEMKQIGAVPPHGTAEQFTQLIGLLMSGGVLEAENYPLPGALHRTDARA